MASSLFGMQLVTFIEKTFELVVMDEDLVLDNFASVENISRFVLRKRACR
jgi:methoxymalonate biosynthesis acyl carrier protein